MRAVRIIAELWNHSMVGRTRFKLMRDPRLIHFWGPLSNCFQEKMERVNKFAKIWKWRSESTVNKKLKIITGVPTITAFVAAFDARALNCTELLKFYLSGGNRIINSYIRQTNRNRHNLNIWQNAGSTFFYKNHICFFLSVLKKTNTLHLYSMCDGTKTLKHNVRTKLQLAYHGCKNLTHTSKTRHVKCTQMVVTVKFTIHVFLVFSDW